MSVYDERPWLALYGGQPADWLPSSTTRWPCSGPGWRGIPRATPCATSTAASPCRELDELSDALAAGLLAPASPPATGWPCTCRTCPSSSSAMVGTWKAGGDRGVDQPDEPGAGAVLPAAGLRGDGAARASSRSTATSRPRGRAATPTCGRCSPPASWSSRRRDDQRLVRRRRADRVRRAPSTSPSCSSATAAQRPPPVAFGPGRRRVPDLHVGDDRAAQGRDEHPRQRGFNAQVYRDWCTLGRTTSILGIAPLFHITGLIGHVAVSLLRRRAAGAGLPVRARDACSTRSSEHRPTFTVGAITAFIALMNAPDVEHGRASSSLTHVYSRRRADPAEHGRGVPGGVGTYIHNVYGLTETTSPSHAVAVRRRRAGGPRRRAPCRSACRSSTRRRGSRTTTGRTSRRARSARSSPSGPQVVAGLLEQAGGDGAGDPRRGAAHRRRRLHGRATAGSTSSTARRT